MTYQDLQFTYALDPAHPGTFRLVTVPPIEAELARQPVPTDARLPTDPRPNDPTPNDIAAAVAILRARHLAAKAAGKGGGRADRGARVVRVSGEAAGPAGEWKREGGVELDGWRGAWGEVV